MLSTLCKKYVEKFQENRPRCNPGTSGHPQKIGLIIHVYVTWRSSFWVVQRVLGGVELRIRGLPFYASDGSTIAYESTLNCPSSRRWTAF